ncbi:MAG: TolC family protein [Bacteroidales bacterium]|nr:TolC family protein [Bacteroidales bacterium]
MKKWMVIFIILKSGALLAQEKVWTLDDCMRYAVENSPKRIKQEAQNEIYRQNRKEAIGSLLPTVNAGTGLGANFGRGVDPETNTYVNVSSLSNSYEIYSSMVLFDGMYRLSTAKLHRLNQLKGEQQLQDVEDMLAYECMELFFNVLYYKGTVALAQQQLDESLANLRQVKRMEELGLKSAPDVAETVAKEAEDRYNLTKQSNLLRLEVIRLKNKMNYPLTDELTIGEAEVTDNIQSKLENLPDMYALATTHSPKILASAKEVEARQMELKGAKGRMFPMISLNGGVNTGFARLMDGGDYMAFNEQLRNKRGYYVSVSLSVPIFNGFSRTTGIQRSKQNVIIAQNDFSEMMQSVFSEIDQAVADMNGLAEEYNQSLRKTQSMEAAHQVNQRKYMEGLVSALELNTSSNRLLQSRIEQLYTHLKYQLKSRLVEYYKGKKFIQITMNN